MEQSTFFSPSSLFSGRSGRRGCTTSLLPSPSLSSLLPRSCNPYRFQGKKTKAGRRRRGGYATGRREIRIKSPITVLYSLRRSPFRVCHEANPLLFSFFLPMRPLFFFSSIVEPRPREEARRANECFPGHP